MAGSPVPPRRQVIEETRLVLEAFLQEALSHGEAVAPGHVGRGYHDSQRYIHRSQVEHTLECPAWSHGHEASGVKEKKHGFRTSFKHLVEKRISYQGLSNSQPSHGDSLKKPKPGAEGARQKRPFSFKNLLKKKGTTSGEAAEPVGPPQRPDFLPLVNCYCGKQPAEPAEARRVEVEAEGAEFYTLVAQKLDHLVKQQQLISPTIAKPSPSPIDLNNAVPADTISGTSAVCAEGPPRELDENQKEQILQKLVALLEEQAGVINKKIEADPLLRNTISRLSYRSFSCLVEAFTSRTPPGVSSPQLAKLALTMELTRKVAGINSHAVHTLMGYSLQYMDMFVPWLQQQGGWENIVAQDLQLD